MPRDATAASSPETVYDALTTVEGLASWWTTDTTGSAEVGGVLQFRFPAGGFDMEVIEQRPSEQVVWEVVDGPDEWVGTTIDWQLRQDDEHTIVMFRHQGWKEPVDSSRWCAALLDGERTSELMDSDHARPVQRGH